MMVRAGLNLGGTGNLGNGVVDNGNTRVYLKNGQKHRLNGPAEKSLNGYEAWFLNGVKHRAGGKPAVTHPSGSTEYWESGKLIKKVSKNK